MENEFYELTNPQKSIWYTEEYFKNSPINNICGSFIIKQKTDLNILNSAINYFIKNNDSFRLRFKKINGELHQFFSKFKECNFELLHLESENQIESFAKKMVAKNINLLTSKPFDLKLFKLKNGFGGFIINCHHIISDAATFSFIAQEIAQNYYKLLNHEIIDAKPYSYIDYINYEKSYINSDKYTKDQEYWNEHLSDTPEIATIPTFNSTDTSKTFVAHRKECFFKKSLVTKINKYCKEHNISMFNFLTAIYSIYFGRINHMNCFTIGTPILNRNNFAQKNTSGMFISTSLLKINIDQNINFIEHTKNITKTTIQMLRHQRYNYQNILSDMRKNNSNIKDLYDIILSYQITKAKDLSIKLPYSVQWYENNFISNTLNVHFHDNNSTGILYAEYDYQILKLNDKDIKNIHNRIEHIIDQVLLDNTILIKNISIITKNEENKILSTLENNNAQYPSNSSIIDLFESQVKKTPNNIAIKYKNSFLTYDQLNQKANQLANYLIMQNIKNNDIVAIRINKSLEMIIGILAILKIGACYLPIDLSYPEERVNFMLRDSKATILLTNNQHINDININVNKIALDSNIYNLANYSCDNLKRCSSPDDLMYIIYTSGSTGTPKGVMITNRNVVRLLKNNKFQFDFSENDIWTMFHSVAFDFSVWEMYGALLYGGKLILIDEKTSKNPDLFLNLLKDEKVTVLNQTPTFFYNLLDREILKDESDLSIKYIIFGGEALNPTLIKPWKDKYPSVKLINMYGITETTVHVTFKELSNTDLLSSASNIGKPIPTLKVYIMDENQHLLPFGVEGEMCVAGLGVCKGYLNRPELNSSRFVINPYNPNELLYRSSDNAVLMENGDLYYKGRIDNQVKIRGFRIELGEIETKLLSNPHVIKCIVLPKKIADRDAFLVAYLVTDNNISINELKNYITPLVPTYMLPSFFVLLDNIPLTNNGKIDKNALLKIKIENKNENVYKKPRTQFEKDFANILENTLEISNVGIDDNIISIGADSITLMSVTIELLKKGYIVNIQDIYELKTIRLISNKLSSLNYTADTQEKLPSNIYYNFDESFSETKIQANNVLLTGCTGYLGIHILADILKNTNMNVYCLIRFKNKQSAKSRLIEKLKYYFGDSLLSCIDNRIKVITSDITTPNLGLSDSKYNSLGKKIDVVIHSAALVNHYGNTELFTSTNINGTKNIIEFCKKFDIRLNHISTTSVSADFYNNSNDNNSVRNFDEHSLYIGQNYSSNIYVKTKFEAELEIHKALQDGLIASVYRIGNITARISDGKFQENSKQNAFLNRLITFIKLHKIPESYSKLIVDLSPVDECSKLITSIFQYCSSYSKVFHIFNNHKIKISDLIDTLNKSNLKIDIISDNEFNQFISSYQTTNEILGIVNDLTSSINITANEINVTSEFTLNYIKKLGLDWTPITDDYIKKFLINYFEKEL